MSEVITTNGIILREKTVGERDRLVTALTTELGLIHGFVNGAKNMKNKNASSTDLFCYSKFSIIRSSTNVFTFRESTPIEVFFPLRQDIIKLSLAQYLADITLDLAGREENSEEFMRVILNAYYLMCEGKKSNLIIKSATELRLLTLAGYMPKIIACDNCGCYETDSMYFNMKTGDLWCENCRTEAAKGSVKTSLGVITAMRHICFSEIKKIFSFNLPDDSLRALSEISEAYTLSITGRKYKTLEFYKSMTI